MSHDDEELIPFFMPALSATLLSAEDKKGEPLTYEEVIHIRDNAPCIMMQVEHAQKITASRGYDDIDPENCWYDWQQLRRELGRKPDLDAGAKVNQIRSSDPEYQQTIHYARNSLDQFRSMLPADGTPRFGASVKTAVDDSDNRAFMWLTNARMRGSNFIAEFFELPVNFTEHAVGDQLEVSPDTLLDWMVNDDGALYGGFSIRYQRSQLPEDERIAFDAHVGVTRYV